MILIGRGLDLGNKGRGNREQEKRKQNPGPGNETWDRGSDLENVKASSEGKSWSDGAERKRTCAVLRVRGKGKRSGREAEAGPKGLAVRQLKRHASWVQNVVRQFGPYPSWAEES